MPPEVCSFLAAHGNGGYLKQSLYLYEGELSKPACEVRAVLGVDHPLAELSLLSVFSNFRSQEVLPDGVIPMFSDSGGAFLCWAQEAVSGCHIVFWSPFDGDPDALEPVAADFDDLLTRLEPLR